MLFFLLFATVVKLSNGATHTLIEKSNSENKKEHRNSPYLPGTLFITSKIGVNVKKNYNDGRDTWRRELIIDPTPADSTVRTPYAPIDCVNEKECEILTFDETSTATFKPFTQEELDKFLKQYAESQNSPLGPEEASNKLTNLYTSDQVNTLENNKDGKSQDKTWQLLNSQVHKHPYDDRKGWVTLEPVPWSQSQVQKWEPNSVKKPQIPQWSGQHYESTQWEKPQNTYTEQTWSSKPSYEYPKPASIKPQYWDNENSFSKPNYELGWNSNSDIITDGRPGGFPSTNDHVSSSNNKPWYNKPPENVYYAQKDIHNSQNQPSEGDGKWVLLSSTKGYSYPNRQQYQRAISVNHNPQQSVSSHRTVRLTVLPALNGTTNTTTSHGGLLEVEQTFQTVDEAQREHAAKMMRLDKVNMTSKSIKKNNRNSTSSAASKRSGTTVKIYPIKAVKQNTDGAVLAAVGAGMIPATMAMLLPIVMGRKKRSAKFSDFTEPDE